MGKHTIEELQQMQAAPLTAKIRMTERRIRDWVDYYGLEGCYVSFSGGKDSLALLNIARNIFPGMKAMFVNTSLEYPEIVKFVKTFDNVDILKPKMNYVDVIKKYGYPIISKEVAECVYGARRYLTQVLEQNSLATDRQTDRQTDRIAITSSELLEQDHIKAIEQGKHHPYQYETDRILGTCRPRKQSQNPSGGTTTSTETQKNLSIPYQFERNKITGNGKYGKQSRNARKQVLGGEGLPETLPILLESERIYNALLTKGFGKTTDNLRIQRLMGINSLQGKNHPILTENVPSKDIPDRSMFSCQRYQFMLDAPFEISQKCCSVMKKSPAHKYCKETGRVPITAQMASESRLRTQQWVRNGCNGFDLKYPISNPMSFWFDDDVLAYLKMNDIKPCKIYGDIVSDDELMGQLDFNDILGSGTLDLGRPDLHTTGCHRSGCIACGFGLTRETSKEKSRFQTILDYSNPKICDWILRGGHFNESGLWEPHQGLGMWFIIEWINKYGRFNIWYPNAGHYIKTYSTPETDAYLKV